MIYKDFKDLKLSALGLGTMRLPVLNGDDNVIDEETTAQMVEYAIQKGINYFDTAWCYHGGNSETVIGKILKKYDRDSFNLVSKFPGYDLDNMDKVEEIFEEQLKKCEVDYFDFYLFHNVHELNIDAYLDPKYGIYDYLMKQKELGRIRHLGFSLHGNQDTLKRFLDAYGKDMEFCQIQLNYLDWSLQSAKEKVEVLREYQIPIWVMEPVRGGKLAALSEEDTATLKGFRPEEGIPAWAFRFLQTIPEVTMVLSGMSNMEQLKDNIKTFETQAPLNEKEWETILKIGEKMADGVPCTACRYCTSHCPQELDIPTLIQLYNERKFTGDIFLIPMRLATIPEEKHPDACLGCQSCEAVCPQQIKISEIMSEFAGLIGK